MVSVPAPQRIIYTFAILGVTTSFSRPLMQRWWHLGCISNGTHTLSIRNSAADLWKLLLCLLFVILIVLICQGQCLFTGTGPREISVSVMCELLYLFWHPEYIDMRSCISFAWAATVVFLRSNSSPGSLRSDVMSQCVHLACKAHARKHIHTKVPCKFAQPAARCDYEAHFQRVMKRWKRRFVQPMLSSKSTNLHHLLE